MLLFSLQFLSRFVSHLLLYNFSSSVLRLFYFLAPTPPLLQVSRPSSSPPLPVLRSSATRPLPSAPALRDEWQSYRCSTLGADWPPGAVARRRPRDHADGRGGRGRSRAPRRGGARATVGGGAGRLEAGGAGAV